MDFEQGAPEPIKLHNAANLAERRRFKAKRNDANRQRLQSPFDYRPNEK